MKFRPIRHRWDNRHHQKTLCAGLGKSDQRYIARRRFVTVFNVGDEFLQVGAGGAQDFRNAFGRGPTQFAFAGDAFGFVEGGGVQACLSRKTGCRQAIGRRQFVHRFPNVAMF